MATSVSFDTVNPQSMNETNTAPPYLERDHQTLHHKLYVSSADGKITNLLCPIELLLEAKAYSAPLIPSRYEPEIFSLFANVATNSYKAMSTRTNNTETVSSRKRKITHGNASTSRTPKKRKKMHANHKLIKNQKSHRKNRQIIDDEDEEEEEDIDMITDGVSSFRYDPTLSVNTRPKRQRKKVSYKEPDPSTIPVLYIEPKTKSKPKKQSQSKDDDESQTIEMRWVQCDKCLKWRRIPTSVSEKELEGEWTCSMNKWDNDRNSCSAAEEAYDLTEEQTVEVNNGSNNGTHFQKKKEFYDALQIFYNSKEVKAKKLDIRQLNESKIGKKTVDFLQLYLEITKRGGYHYCLERELFDDVFASLSCFQSDLIKQARMSLKNLYTVYLVDYERKYFNVSREASGQPFIADQVIENKQLTLQTKF